MQSYTPRSSSANVAQKESHDLRMKQNLERRAVLRRKAEELEEELARIKLEINMNKLEGAAMHNEQVLILRLPAEITAYIFEMARGQTRFDNSARGGPWKSIKKRPEIIISHVCRSWRSMALAHPALWSHFLHIHSDRPVPLDWMFVYLQRSKNKPLDILLDLSLVREEQDPNDYVETILDILTPHALRWRRLSIAYTYPDYPPAEDEDEVREMLRVKPMPLRALTAPIIEVLEIEYIGCSGPEYAEEEHPIFLGGAKNLVSVRMESFRCSKNMPSSTITTLHLYGTGEGFLTSNVPWSTFLLVMATPTLENLTVEGMCFNELSPIANAPRNIPRIVAPSLVNLRLYASYEVVDDIWDFVEAPKLELFSIINTAHTNNSTPILQDLSLSSFASLKTLVMFSCDLEIDFLLALSRVTNGLIHLIFDAAMVETYIEHMISLGPSSVPWPNLESLTCAIHPPNDINFVGLNLADFAKVMSWQAAVSGKPCLLRVDAGIANYWISHSRSKVLWEYLLDTGVVEVANEYGPYSSILPWPHHGSGHFRIGKSELDVDI